MEDCLEVGVGGVEEVGGVVAAVVVGSFAGSAVVAAASGESGGVEVGDGLLVADAEGEVEVRGGRSLQEGEGRAFGGELEAVAEVTRPQADGWRDCRVEALDWLEVGDADPEVVDEAVRSVRRGVTDCLDAVAVVVADDRRRG